MTLKTLSTLICIVLIMGACTNTGRSLSEYKHPKYMVKVCNSVGCNTYFADSVSKSNGAYMLYTDGSLTTEVSAQIVVIDKLNP